MNISASSLMSDVASAEYGHDQEAPREVPALPFVL